MMRTTVHANYITYEVLCGDKVIWQRSIRIRSKYAARQMLAREQERVALEHRPGRG